MDESRKQFEEWMNGYFTHPSSLDVSENGFYMNPHTANYWRAWQASRSAIEIELPTWFVSDAIAVYDRDDVDEAIRAAGIKVKE